MIEADLIALADHLWQSTLFAVVLAGLSLLLRRHGARVRYALWLAASIKFLVPLGLLTFIGTQILGHLITAPGDPPGLIWIADEIAAPKTLLRVLAASPGGAASSGEVLLILLAVIWAAGTLAVGTRWLLQWTKVRQALRSSTPACLPFIVPVRSCSLQLEPGIVGILRPVLLLPQGVEQRLSCEELRAIMDHERCHVIWRDNLAAASHMLTEALFWFHPLVWWLGARLVDERERACDEHVLAVDHAPESYAEGILKVCELCLAVDLPCVSGIGRASLKRRIEDIMQNRLVQRISRARKIVILAVAGVTAAAPVAMGTFTTLPARAHVQLATAAASDFRNIVVRLNTADDQSSHCQMLMGWDRRVRVRNCTLRDLITAAYDVSLPQVVADQSSTAAAVDITADVRGGVEPEVALSRLPGMLRRLLATRLGVVINSERRQVDGYALGVSAGGSKLRGSGRSIAMIRGTFRPDGIDMIDLPLDALASTLSNYLGAPVTDQTGLKGSYDFKVRWQQSSPGAPVDPVVLARSLEEQLGLRIEARPVTVEMINIVSVKLP